MPFKVDLYMLPEFLGIIVPMPSKVTWSNQVGGTLCSHPEAEGVYVPLPAWIPEPDPMTDYWFSYASENDYQQRAFFRIQGLLRAEPNLRRLFREMSPREMQDFVDAGGSRTIAEAWVPVRVREDLPDTTYEAQVLPFRGLPVILVYTNSD